MEWRILIVLFRTALSMTISRPDKIYTTIWSIGITSLFARFVATSTYQKEHRKGTKSIIMGHPIQYIYSPIRVSVSLISNIIIRFQRILNNKSVEDFSGVLYTMTLVFCLLSAWLVGLAPEESQFLARQYDNKIEPINADGRNSFGWQENLPMGINAYGFEKPSAIQQPVGVLLKCDEERMKQFIVNVEKEEWKIETQCESYETLAMCTMNIMMREVLSGSSTVLVRTHLMARGVDMQQQLTKVEDLKIRLEAMEGSARLGGLCRHV